MPPDIETAVSRNRARIIAGIERPLVRQLAADYARILDRVERGMAALVADLASSGQMPTWSQIIADARYAAIEAQVAIEMRAAAVRTGVVVTEAQRAAVGLGAQAAAGLMAEAIPGPSALRIPAIQNMIAALVDPSPLLDLVRTIPGASVEAMRNALIDGVAMGDNPRVTARNIRRAVNVPASRALNIARTETHRAYRGAALEAYRENDDAIEGWVWVAATDSRTCAVCWAMHGTVHDLDETLESHPQCRCSMGPMPRTRRADLRPDVGTGEARFAELSAAEQRDILGPTKQAAYARGEVTLSDLVGYRRDARWGGTRYERPLRAVQGRGAA